MIKEIADLTEKNILEFMVNNYDFKESNENRTNKLDDIYRLPIYRVKKGIVINEARKDLLYINKVIFYLKDSRPSGKTELYFMDKRIYSTSVEYVGKRPFRPQEDNEDNRLLLDRILKQMKEIY